MTVRPETVIILNSSLAFLSDSAVAPFLLGYLRMSKETVLGHHRQYCPVQTLHMSLNFYTDNPLCAGSPTAADVGRPYK